MKQLLLLTCLTLPVSAWAQKDYTPLKESETVTLLSPANLYRQLSDTAGSKPSMQLKKGDEALLLGQANRRWAAVRKAGFVYFMPQAALTGSNLVDVATREQWLNEPLPLDAETKQYTYQGVKEVVGVSKNDLYSRGFEWVARSYRSAQSVIQMQDKEAGKIIIKALTTPYSKGGDIGTVSYTLSLYFKDGRYKYVLSDFVHKAPIGNQYIYSGGPLETPEPKIAMVRSKAIWTDIQRSVARNSRSLIASLEAAMAVPAGKDPSDF